MLLTRLFRGKSSRSSWYRVRVYRKKVSWQKILSFLPANRRVFAISDYRREMLRPVSPIVTRGPSTRARHNTVTVYINALRRSVTFNILCFISILQTSKPAMDLRPLGIFRFQIRKYVEILYGFRIPYYRERRKQNFRVQNRKNPSGLNFVRL